MKRPPVALVQYLFFFTAVVLMAFGVYSMFRASPPDSNMKAVYMVYAVLMLGDALAMLACGLLIRGRIPAIFWFAVTLLGLNIILTIFDQFGLVDLLFVLLNASTLGFVIHLRKELLPNEADI
jgi:hypothetical protein